MISYYVFLEKDAQICYKISFPEKETENLLPVCNREIYPEIITGLENIYENNLNI